MEEASQHAALLLCQELLRHSSLELVRALAEVATRLEQAALRQGVLDALAQAAGSDPAGLDEIWGVWEQARHPGLEALLLGVGNPASHPVRLHVMSTLKLAANDPLRAEAQLEEWSAPAGVEVVEPLLAAADDLDPQIAVSAQMALQSLKNPAAQDEVCRWVIEHDHAAARQAALTGDFAPREPQRRAMYYLLTEQWARYETLDFDTSLLNAVYQAADEALRHKIATLARQTGWAGYTQVLTGERSSRRLSELSEAEWEVILTLLGRHQRWEEAWRLAQAAPPVWSARLLRGLYDAGWAMPEAGDKPPEDDERLALVRLAQAGKTCLELGIPLEKLPREPQLLLGHNRSIAALAFSPDGQVLASGSADRTVRLWRMSGQVAPVEAYARLDGHTGFVVALAFSPDGQVLASGSSDRTVRLWQPAQGMPPAVLGGHAGEVTALAFSPDGEALASGDPAAARLWRSADNRLLHILSAPEWGVVSLAFSPDGLFLACGRSDHALHLWRMPEGLELGTLMEKVACWSFGPSDRAGGWLLATASSYDQVRLWQVATLSLLKTLEGRVDGEQLVASPDGRLLAASSRQRILVWELPGGEPLVTLAGETAAEGHTRRVTALAFSPDGRILASAGEDKTLRLWQMPDGKLLHMWEGFSASPKRLVFNLAGLRLAWADQEKLYLCPLEDLGRLWRAPVGRLGVQALIQETLKRGDLPEVESAWLAFTLELHRWHGRFDIEIAAAPDHLAVGDFDIELAD